MKSRLWRVGAALKKAMASAVIKKAKFIEFVGPIGVVEFF